MFSNALHSFWHSVTQIYRDAGTPEKRLALFGLLVMPVTLASTRAGMDISLSGIAIMYLLHLLRVRAFRSLWQPTEMKWLFALWGWLVLRSVPDLFAFPESVWHAFTYVRFLVFYAALKYWLLDARVMPVLARWLLLVLALVAVDAGVQYVTGTSLSTYPIMGYRLTGPLGEPNVGNYVMKLLFPTLAITSLFMAGWRRVVLAVLVAGAVLVPLTGERSITLLSWLSALVVITSLATLPKLRTPAMISVVVLVLGTALTFTQPVAQMRAQMTAEHMSRFTETPYGQLIKGGALVFAEHPLRGIGIKRYHDVCAPMQQEGRVTYCDLHPHNTYVQWFAEAGVVGGILFLLVVGRWLGELLAAWRRSHEDTRVSIALVAGGMVMLLFPLTFTQSFFSNWPAALFWFALALNMGTLRRA